MWYVAIWLAVTPAPVNPEFIMTSLNKEECEAVTNLVNSGILQPLDKTIKYRAVCYSNS